jgi:hypothetical protein
LNSNHNSNNSSFRNNNTNSVHKSIEFFKKEKEIKIIEKKLNIFKKLKKMNINEDIVEIRETRKKIIFIEHALQLIFINYIKIIFFLNKKSINENNKQLKKISSTIYYFCLIDFYEFDFNVDKINLKTVFVEIWNYFLPYGLKLNKNQIEELLQYFDTFIFKNQNNNFNYDNIEENIFIYDNNKNINYNTIPFNIFCKWFVMDIYGEKIKILFK